MYFFSSSTGSKSGLQRLRIHPQRRKPEESGRKNGERRRIKE